MPLPAVSHWRHTVYGLSIRVFVCPSVWPSVHAWLCVKSLWPRHLTAVQLQLHRARLVLGWVTVFGFSSRCRSFISVCDQPPRSTQSGHPFVGRCSEYQPKMYRVRFWGQRSRSRPNVVKKGQGILKVVHSNRVWSQTVRVRAPPPPRHAPGIWVLPRSWSRSLSFEGDLDSGPDLFHLDFCVILLQCIWLLCNLFYNANSVCTRLCTFC